MNKTAGEVETDVFNLLKNSQLSNIIGGTIYREGMRPLDAKTEDAVISFIAGDSEQIQTGKININIYVADIDIGNGGILVKNIARCTEIESVLRRIADSMLHCGGYWFAADSIIRTFAEDSIKQHFVNLKLKFKYFTL